MPDDPSLSPLLEQDDDGGSIRRAAWILEDAIFGITSSKYPSSVEARNFHLRVQRSEKWYEWALLGLVVLSFIEAPTWCSSQTPGWSWIAGSQRCFVIVNGKYANLFLSGLAYIPPNYGMIVELACMAIILRKFVMQWARELMFFRHMGVQYQNQWEINFGITIVFLGFLDCAIYGMFRNHFRLVLVTRSGLLMMLPSVQSLTRVAIAVISDVSFIMMFLFGSILMFAWVTVTLFHDFKSRNQEGVKISEGFDNFPDAVYSMFLSSVTDEAFIEKFMPTFTAFRITGFLWLFFLVLVHLLLLNLVLDTLVAGYANVSESRTKSCAKNQAKGVLKAFAACCAGRTDPEDALVLSKECFIALLSELGRSPYLGTMNKDIAHAFFNAVDQDSSGEIDQSEFIQICKVMNYDFWHCRYGSCFEQEFPSMWNHKWHKQFRDWFENGQFEKFMNLVLMLNLGLMILETVYDLHDWDEPALLDSVELWFSIVYVVEIGLKLTVISCAEFWSTKANQFDFWTTFILLFNSILSSYPALDSVFNVDSRYANMLRVLRLLRVLKTIKRLEEVRFLTGTIMKIVSLSKDIMTLLGVIIFIFSQVSVQLFGGLLYEGNPKLAGTEYVENKWYVLNYNDLPMAFGVYFVSLLVEFEPVFAEVIARVAPFKLEWIITGFYYICACAVVFELLQAFTIETFVELYTKHKKKLKRKKKENGKDNGKEDEEHEKECAEESESDEESDDEEVFPRYDLVQRHFEEKGEHIHYTTINGRTGEWDKALEEAFDELLDEVKESEENVSNPGSFNGQQHGHGMLSRQNSGDAFSTASDMSMSNPARHFPSAPHVLHRAREEEELLMKRRQTLHRQTLNPFLEKPVKASPRSLATFGH